MTKRAVALQSVVERVQATPFASLAVGSDSVGVFGVHWSVVDRDPAVRPGHVVTWAGPETSGTNPLPYAPNVADTFVVPEASADEHRPQGLHARRAHHRDGPGGAAHRRVPSDPDHESADLHGADGRDPGPAVDPGRLDVLFNELREISAQGGDLLKMGEPRRWRSLHAQVRRHLQRERGEPAGDPGAEGGGLVQR